MTLRQHITNLICATISITAMTAAARVAAERIDGVGSRAWINTGAFVFTTWVFVAVWLLWAVCAAASYGARYARGDMRRRPGHGGRAPSWTRAQWAAVEQPQHDALVADVWVGELEAADAAARALWDVAA